MAGSTGTMRIPKADSVIAWIAKMRDYFEVPDKILFDEDISVWEIMYLANSHAQYIQYKGIVEEKMMKKK